MAKKATGKSLRASSLRAPASKGKKHVYFFGNGKADGNRDMKDSSAERAPAWPR